MCIRPNECSRRYPLLQGIFDSWRYLCGYIGGLEWSWPAGPGSLQMLVHFSWYIGITNQNAMSLSIISRRSKTDSRSGETEVTALCYCVMSGRISTISKSLGMTQKSTLTVIP